MTDPLDDLLLTAKRLGVEVRFSTTGGVWWWSAYAGKRLLASRRSPGALAEWLRADEAANAVECDPRSFLG